MDMIHVLLPARASSGSAIHQLVAPSVHGQKKSYDDSVFLDEQKRTKAKGEWLRVWDTYVTWLLPGFQGSAGSVWPVLTDGCNQSPAGAMYICMGADLLKKTNISTREPCLKKQKPVFIF